MRRRFRGSRPRTAHPRSARRADEPAAIEIAVDGMREICAQRFYARPLRCSVLLRGDGRLVRFTAADGAGSKRGTRRCERRTQAINWTGLEAHLVNPRGGSLLTARTGHPILASGGPLPRGICDSTE